MRPEKGGNGGGWGDRETGNERGQGDGGVEGARAYGAGAVETQESVPNRMQESQNATESSESQRTNEKKEEEKRHAPNSRSSIIHLIMRTSQETRLVRLTDIRYIIEHRLLHSHLHESRQGRCRNLHYSQKKQTESISFDQRTRRDENIGI